MIVSLNKQYAPINEVKLCGIRNGSVVEYYEFYFQFKGGVIRSNNTQFRLQIDQDHPNYHDLVKNGQAMDPTRYANKRMNELLEVANRAKENGGQGIGQFVEPTFWAIVPHGTKVDPDFTEIASRTRAVLDGHRVLDAVRASLAGDVTVSAPNVNETVICVQSPGAQSMGISVPVPAAELVIPKKVTFGQPLLSFGPNHGEASREWVQGQIGANATTQIATTQGKQLAYDIDLLSEVPGEASLWVDARRLSTFFSMPARWSTRHVRFEARSPHRQTALKAAGIVVDDQRD